MVEYEGFIIELKAKRTALDRDRAELDTAIAAIERLVPAVRDEPRGVGLRAFAGLTMPQALAKYAKVSRQTQTTSQVAGALRAGGMPASAKSFKNQVYNLLRRLSVSGGPWQRESDGRWSPRIGQPAQPNPDNARAAVVL